MSCLLEKILKTLEKRAGKTKTPCYVSWAEKTWTVYHEQMSQGSTPHLANTPPQGIQKQDHVDKSRGQKIQKIYVKQRHVDKRYAQKRAGKTKTLCYVSWAEKTWTVYHEQTSQGSTPYLANTPPQGIQKQDHVDKSRGQKIQKIYVKQRHVDKRYVHMTKRYARNKDESNQVSTR
jgi:hypothetical protein